MPHRAMRRSTVATVIFAPLLASFVVGCAGDGPVWNDVSASSARLNSDDEAQGAVAEGSVDDGRGQPGVGEGGAAGTDDCMSGRQVGVCDFGCGEGVLLDDPCCAEKCLAPRPRAEVCDHRDNDCDGRVDEGTRRNRCDIRSCEATPKEICDGRDNDCDLLVDEDFDLNTDDQHCGKCDQRCEELQRCQAGRCKPIPDCPWTDPKCIR
ncbi:MAG: MopE-related protein [Myxococcales bacterium]|nr:MopE-related protein [Myxococcales bacterium]